MDKRTRSTCTSDTGMINPARVSCETFLLHSTLVKINDKALTAFVQDESLLPPPDTLLQFSIGDTNSFPELQFSSLQEEMAFVVFCHGLDFGSGFRHLLHQHRNGQGAWLTIRAGLVALGQRKDFGLNSSFLLSLTLQDIQTAFDIGHVDLEPLAQQILSVVHEYGTTLRQQAGDVSLAEYITKFLDQEGYSAVRLALHLVESFPLTFRDEYPMPVQVTGDERAGQPQQLLTVKLYKKAQLVASEMYYLALRRQQTDKEASKYTFPDHGNLTAFVDNVIVATLRKMGVLQCDANVNDAIDAGEPLVSGSLEELSLRAVSLVAVDRIVKAYNAKYGLPWSEEGQTSLTASLLSNYLWGSLGKRPDFRKYQRHHTPSTLFY